MPRESAARREPEQTPDLHLEEKAPSPERHLKLVPHPEDDVFAEEALQNIRRHLDTEQALQPDMERQNALAATATMRANSLKRASELKRTDPERAWELLQELHSYEFDLEGELEKANEFPEYVRGTDAGMMSRRSLEDALTAVRSALAEIRPSVHSVASRMEEEDSKASDAHRTFWDDARETRQALETGTLDADERSRLATLFKERAAQVDTEHTLLLNRAMESRSSEDRQAVENAARAMTELQAALFALRRAEDEKVKKPASSEEPAMRPSSREKEAKKIEAKQKKIEMEIMAQYGMRPDELIARGGTGFKGMLGRLIGRDDPFEQWRELDRRRIELEQD